MKKYFNILKRQAYNKRITLLYTKVDKDTYEINNGHSKFSVRVVTSKRVKELEVVRENVASQLMMSS